MDSITTVLLISGMDPTGGAGMSADIRTCQELVCYPFSCVTALTVQNHLGVKSVNPVAGQLVHDQLEAIYQSCRPDAVKIGLIPDIDVLSAITDVMRAHDQHNIVLDPVIKATSGGNLAQDNKEFLRHLVEDLAPLTTLITPNVSELSVLTDTFGDPDFLTRNSNAILLKGGDNGNPDVCRDVLVTEQDATCFESPRIDSRNLHGTGCVLSSAIACFLSQKFSLNDAVSNAKSFINAAIKASAPLSLIPDYGPCFVQIP